VTAAREESAVRVLDDDNLDEFFLLMAQGLNAREAWEEFMGKGVPLSDEEALELERLYDLSPYGIQAPRRRWEEGYG